MAACGGWRARGGASVPCGLQGELQLAEFAALCQERLLMRKEGIGSNARILAALLAGRPSPTVLCCNVAVPAAEPCVCVCCA